MRSTKSEWFSRLRSGAGGKASQQRPSALDGHAQRHHGGSFTRFTTALKLWLLSTLPLVQFSRPAPKPPAGSTAAAAAQSSERAEPSATARGPDYQQALLENLRADTKLKQLQAQALQDEHELLSLKCREYELNIENAEIKRGLTLIGVVVIGATIVAGLVIGIADPSVKQPGLNVFEIFKLLLG